MCVRNINTSLYGVLEVIGASVISLRALTDIYNFNCCCKSKIVFKNKAVERKKIKISNGIKEWILQDEFFV